MTEMGETRIRRGLLAVGLFVLGALAVLEINDSPLLPGAHADSVQYMEAARSLVSGRGLTLPMAAWNSPEDVSPLSHFPPGMSVGIAALMRVAGVRPDVASLWLIALAAGLTLALVFLLVSPGEGARAGVLSALVIGVLPPFLLVHAAIWSEPLYLPLLLATLWLMVNRPRQPALAGTVAGLAVLVRYLGLAAVVSVGIWTYLKTRSVKKALLGVAPGVGAFFLWWAWTRGQGDAVREWGEFSVPLYRTLSQLPGFIQFWLAPGLPVVVAVVLLLGVAAILMKSRMALQAPLALLLLAHTGMIVLSRLLVDQRIHFDHRMFLPVIVLAMLPVASFLWRRKALGLVALAAWAGWILKEDVEGIGTARASGLYYTSASWLGSGVISWLHTVPEDLRIYSNDPGFVVFYAQRSARFLPLRTGDIQEFFRFWERHPGAIVLLHPLRPDEWSHEVYVEGLPLETVVNSGNVVVLVP